MTYNRFIGNAPILIPMLIVAALVLVTWYRPAAQTVPAIASGGQKSTQGLRSTAPQGDAKPVQ